MDNYTLAYCAMISTIICSILIVLFMIPYFINKYCNISSNINNIANTKTCKSVMSPLISYCSPYPNSSICKYVLN